MNQNSVPQSDSASILYRVKHRTHYQYSSDVSVCQNQLRMQPVSGGNLQCHRSQIRIEPAPTTIESHFDYFGNHVQTFSIESVHRSLVVTASSVVSIEPQAVIDEDSTPPWEQCSSSIELAPAEPLIDEHRFNSPLVRCGEPFAQYATSSFTPGRSLLAASLDLTRRIHADFRYDTTVTTVNTTPEEAFAIRAGVCQDFAHIQIACLRSIGLAARYVSGYLRTTPPPGKPRMVGADESHAWLEVHAGKDVGWIGLDPTNACMVSTNHIPICVGRDYGDVSPMRGVVLGGGAHTLKVSVDVEPIEDKSKS
ncbi:transglutaminase family protein [Stieleria varia]|uniref:Transglutaminase-like domain-containing protein n=1 Tax=Stieleria varia TaxID=2528005 RepID=A0A5C6AGZ8_9BACT|nr:transglutaminase family protein [Stieleria varia]TWT98676.1 hypothetical protein Pla52n_51930 [Stieleria varia]